MKTTKITSLAALVLCLPGPVGAEKISLQSAPPVVVRTVPVAGATDVDPALTEIRVTYSKPMQDGSWSWSTWGEENFPEMIGQPRYLADGRTCVLTVKLQPGKFYATWLNSDKFKNFKDAAGRPAVPYLLTFRTGGSGGGGAGGTKRDSALDDIDARIVGLSKEGTTVAEVVRALGEPREYVWGKETFTKANLPDTYILVYPKGVHVMASGGVVTELRSESPGPGFTWRGKLRLGSSLDEVLQMVGQPSETVAGKGLDFSPGVMYKDIEGKKGYGYYSRPDQNVRFFFWNSKVSALYVTPGSNRGGGGGGGAGGDVSAEFMRLLSDDQRVVVAWTDRQFRSFFDARTFDGWPEEERSSLEKRLIDTLSGPLTREYYQAINTLAALRSKRALPKLREIAFDRREKDNRDRWMAVRALGILGDKTAVPELVHLVYHGNANTRWWAQISLVRLTRQNFARDWNGWGKWWNDQHGQPVYQPEIIRWWPSQAEPEKLAESLEESDRKFVDGLKSRSENAAAP